VRELQTATVARVNNAAHFSTFLSAGQGDGRIRLPGAIGATHGTAHVLHVAGKVAFVTAAHIVCSGTKNCSAGYQQCSLGGADYDLAVFDGCPRDFIAANGHTLHALNVDGGGGVIDPMSGMKGLVLGDGLHWRVDETLCSHPLFAPEQAVNTTWVIAQTGEMVLASTSHVGFSGAAILYVIMQSWRTC